MAWHDDSGRCGSIAAAMATELTTIFAAVTAEAGPLVRRLKLRRDAAPNIWTRVGLRLVITGMGRVDLRRRMKNEVTAHRPQRVVMFGVAGAASPDLHIADVIVPAQVIDLRDGRTFTPAWGGAGLTPHRLGTADEVACDAAAKTLLRSRHAVDAIDMETAEFAVLAQQHELPWLCVRGISDDAHGSIPRFALDLTDGAGRPRIARAAMRIISGPWRLPPLLRLGRDTHRAAEAAAVRLDELL